MDVNPVVPFTLDGASVLHQMMRIAWPEWNALEEDQREGIGAEFAQWLSDNPRSGCYAMLGHKGDLMLVHYRDDFAGLLEAQTSIRRLAIGEFLDPTTSYVSVVELGLYESTRKIHEELAARDITPASEGWDAAVREMLDRQRKAMATRLNPEIPETRYLCFYPMDRRRGEQKNWYMVPFAERQRMMHEHGMVGRKYAGTVKQVISGSIGFDDWEWGVDLYADDPLVFKKLIYEMRFDEVSADYALFGSFYIGLRLEGAGVTEFMQQPA